MISISEIIGNSMEPTLSNGQLALFIKYRKLERRQIVKFKHNQKNLVKRIIGLPNEKIILDENGCSIDDELIFPELTTFPLSYEWNLNHEQFILLGDNLDDSLDSRKLGPINVKQITHRYVLRIR